MKRTLLIAFILSAFYSCSDDDSFEMTSIGELSNEWHVRLLLRNGDNTLTDVGNGYHHMVTANTSTDNGDSMWVDNRNNTTVSIKSKVSVDTDNLTFSNAKSVTEVYSGQQIFISDGQVYKALGKTFAGNVVDSVYFEVAFNTDTTYVIGGHQRTGFQEDEISSLE